MALNPHSQTTQCSATAQDARPMQLGFILGQSLRAPLYEQTVLIERRA